jgi:hypothetical protein
MRVMGGSPGGPARPITTSTTPWVDTSSWNQPTGGSGSSPWLRSTYTTSTPGIDPATQAAAQSQINQSQATIAGLQAQAAIARARAALMGQMGGGGGGPSAAAIAAANRQADIQIAGAQRQMNTYLPELFRNAAAQHATALERLAAQARTSRSQFRTGVKESRRTNRDQTNAFRSDVIARGATIAPGTVKGFQSLEDALAAQITAARTGLKDSLHGVRTARRQSNLELRRNVAGLVEQQADLRDRIAQLEIQKQLNAMGGGGGRGRGSSAALAQLDLMAQMAGINAQIAQAEAEAAAATALLPQGSSERAQAEAAQGSMMPAGSTASGNSGRYVRPDGR